MCGCKSNYLGTDDYTPCTCSDNTVSYVGDEDFMENFRGRRKGNAKLRKKLGRKTLAGKVLRIGMLGSPLAPLVIGETVGGRIKKKRSRKARRSQKAAPPKPEQSPLPILGNQMPEPQYNQPEMEDPGMQQLSEPEPQAPEDVPEEAQMESEQTEDQDYMSSFASPDEEKKKKDMKTAIIVGISLFIAALIIFFVTRNFKK